MIQRANVEQMKSSELLRLARVLKLPILDRKIARESLVDKIMVEIEARNKREFIEMKLNSPAIKIENLIKRFGKKVAVWGLNLKVNPGEIVGLVGPNGAGKTTTLRILTGIIKPTSGSVEVDGYDMLDNPIPAKSAIGYIPEKPTCYPSLTVREYVTFMARIYEVPNEIALVRMRQFVDMFQLDEYLDSYIGTLSKGNLQRALLVGIFVRDPPYVLALDEPIYGLDPRGAWNLKAYLRQLRDEGSAILISTHILEVASDLCDRFVIMNEGSVVGRGTLEELLASQKEARSLEEVFLSLTGGIPE
ncbi:ABC transporter ATP-binding protein [Candidatus Thorarchaeota archaeon]|nr:MAG: ABC transporter ATP-binding protein [Candidatus Thorarchaeota archaeon]